MTNRPLSCEESAELTVPEWIFMNCRSGDELTVQILPTGQVAVIHKAKAIACVSPTMDQIERDNAMRFGSGPVAPDVTPEMTSALVSLASEFLDEMTKAARAQNSGEAIWQAASLGLSKAWGLGARDGMKFERLLAKKRKRRTAKP